MVGRAFLEALKFGAPGGAVLALALIIFMGAANDDGPLTWGLAWVGLWAALYGAALGVAIGFAASIAGSIAADLTRRWVGALAAFLVTLVGLEIFFGWDDPTSLWAPMPVGIGMYAAVVGWFRIPRILQPLGG